MRPGEFKILVALMKVNEVVEAFLANLDKPEDFKVLATLMKEPDSTYTQLKHKVKLSPPKGLTYTQLKQITKLSPPVLSDYLKGFVKEGIILKDPERKLYFLPSAYKRSQNLRDFWRSVSIFMRNIPFEGTRIALVGDKDLRRRIYGDFLSFHMHNISILLVTALRESMIEARTDMKRAYGSGAKLQRKALAEHIARSMEAETSQYNAKIQEKVLNWIIPYIQMLALAYMANAEFTLAGIDKELPQRFSKEAVEKTWWFRQLEAIDQEWANRDPKIAELLRKRKELEETLSEGQNTKNQTAKS